jgi:hypothetical protein
MVQHRAFYIPALFSGIIATDLPQDDAWSRAYQLDKNCYNIIKMLKTPSLITPRKIPFIEPQCAIRISG